VNAQRVLVEAPECRKEVPPCLDMVRARYSITFKLRLRTGAV
jgi:hypothetical protein